MTRYYYGIFSIYGHAGKACRLHEMPSKLSLVKILLIRNLSSCIKTVQLLMVKQKLVIFVYFHFNDSSLSLQLYKSHCWAWVFFTIGGKLTYHTIVIRSLVGWFLSLTIPIVFNHSIDSYQPTHLLSFLTYSPFLFTYIICLVLRQILSLSTFIFDNLAVVMTTIQ